MESIKLFRYEGEKSFDPAHRRQNGSGPHADQTHVRWSEPYDDPTQGQKIGSRPYDDVTQGRKIGSRPYDDPTRTS
jgi:hypothetical protein